ncbi:MAG TPA: histidine kinase, partial [Flavisolibacter sp.]|nr:histidine kinase [Flavisolibacter sp.]
FRSLIHMPFRLAGSIAFNFPAFILTVAVSFTYKMLNDRSLMEKLSYEKQEQNMKTEVSFLRSQISPHFIFNVLNNLVALIRMKSEELEPTVMKLSGLMQYMLYETDEEKVPLKHETEYLQNYIDLQQQRFGSKVKLTSCFNIPDEFYSIEPMLLIPFVENAFKHGVGMINDPQIDIKLYMKENLLYFNVRNMYNPLNNEVKDKSSGIGLANVTRRLSLLYPERHSLLINKDDYFFNISLQIILAK